MKRFPVSERGWGRLSMLIAVMLGGGPLCAAERLTLEVRETAGLARRGSPAAVQLSLPASVARETPFRLLDDAGQPVEAQFRPHLEAERSADWRLDFRATLSPLESRRFTVEYGEGVSRSPEPSRGHRLETQDDAFLIANAPYIVWTVPRDGRGLMRTVDFPPNQHLRRDSTGLYVVDRQGRRHVLGGAGVRASVLRQGRLAVALRFAGRFEDGPLEGLQWQADLTFPGPVSWVEVDCTLDDPQDRVERLGLELSLALEAPQAESPTLADFGAWTSIYTTLAAGERAEMHAQGGIGVGGRSSRCAVLKGKAGALATVAEKPLPAEGWLHLMDRRQCLAMAVHGFGEAAEDVLAVTAEGLASYERRFPAGADGESKSLRAWMHFVYFPPQQSAATSPQMMQNPPQVRVVQTE